MAGLGIQAINAAAVALAAATPKTIIAIAAPSNQRVLVREWSVTFDGVTSSAVPVLVELVVYSPSGTSTALPLTKKVQGDPETIQSVGKENFSVEPTTAVVVDAPPLISPTSGYAKVLPLGQEEVCNGGRMIGIRVTAPATVNARGTIRATE